MIAVQIFLNNLIIILSKFFNTYEKRSVLKNFLSLGLVQISNYFLPFITFPYLIRVLGVEKFGLINFAKATVMYFLILVDYGFNLTATRDVSIHRNDKKKLDEIFSNVMATKIVLFFLSTILFFFMVFCFEKFSKDLIVYIITFGMVIGYVLNPIWFFQGVEEMKYISILDFISKLFSSVAIFLFVNDKDDIYMVAFLYSLGFIISGIIAIIIIVCKFQINFTLPSLRIIKQTLKDGWQVFLSRIFVSLYTTINVFFLGILTDNIAVGYYTIVDKIISAIGVIYNIANQAVYPYITRVYDEDVNNFWGIIKKLSIIFLITSIIIFIIFLGFRRIILSLIAGTVSNELLNIYSVLTLSIILIPYGPLFTNIFIIQRKYTYYSESLRNSVILNVILAPIMIHFFSALGLSFVVVLCYGYIVFALSYKLYNLYKFKLNHQD